MNPDPDPAASVRAEVTDIPRPDAHHGQAVLIVLGWYATIVSAAVVAVLSMPQPRSAACAALFSCRTTPEPLGLVTVLYGLPFFAGAMAVAALGLWVLRRALGSPVVRGTVAAWLGVVVVIAGIVAVAFRSAGPS